MSNLSRKQNMITAAMDGITKAQEDMYGPGGFEKMLKALREDFPTKEEDSRGLTISQAAYLATMFLAWERAGCPSINNT